MGIIEITGSINDGWVENQATYWASCINGYWGISANSSETENAECIQASFEEGEFKIRRTFLYFDLSNLSLRKHSVITGARLKLYGYGYSSAIKICVQEGTQADTLLTGDFSFFTGPSFGENVFDFISSRVNPISFNENGIAYLNQQLGSMARFCLREYDHDYCQVIPNDIFKSGMYFSEVSGSDRKPTLEIIYQTSSDPIIITVTDDGEVNSSPLGTWQENLDEETGDAVVTDDEYFYFYDDGNTNRRYFFYFDASDFPEGVTVTNVTFSVYGSVIDPVDEGIGASLFKGTQGDTLAVEDYDSFTGNVISSLDPDDGTIGWFDFVLNAEGISAVNDMLSDPSKMLKFCLRSTRFDVNRETPLGSAWSPGFEIYTAENTYNPESDPKITIEFDLPANQDSCETNGWYWYDGACHLDFPNNQSECESHGYYWYGDACHLDLPDNETECSGYTYYWYYGECQLSNKIGVIPCVCIDTVEKIWLVAGHEVAEINEVFVSISGSDEPRLRTTGFERYPAYDYEKGLNGKIAVIRFTDNPPDATGKVWCNVKGMKNAGGNLIENPIEIMTHFLTSYLGMTTSNYNETGFEAARLQAETDGHIGAGMIKDHPKGIDVIEEVAHSIGATLFFDRDGKLNIRGIS
ncbi:MAG: hypothetical protein KJ737_16665 [Proteobacteria bacterium]|nr:hypothetical protein [Pseudomonadota bacterium]